MWKINKSKVLIDISEEENNTLQQQTCKVRVEQHTVTQKRVVFFLCVWQYSITSYNMFLLFVVLEEILSSVCWLDVTCFFSDFNSLLVCRTFVPLLFIY